MSDSEQVLWGGILTAYVVIYGGWEIFRQVRRGNDFTVDRQSILGSLTLVGLVVLWGMKASPVLAVLLLLAVGTGVIAWWIRARFKGLATPAWLVGVRRLAALLGAAVWTYLLLKLLDRWSSDSQGAVAALFPLGYLLGYIAVEWVLRGFLPANVREGRKQ